jgi:hypothetical protein
MNRILFLILSLIAVCNIGSTCKKNKSNCHRYFTVKNNSNKAIYFIWHADTAVSLLNYPPGASPVDYKCEANNQKIYFSRSCFEAIINNTSNKMLNVFIFNAETIETVSWDTIKKNYMLLKRYDLTKAQLDSANWIINYP